MKSPVIRIAPLADCDLDEIVSYISSDNLEAAIRFLSATRNEFQQLAGMPGIGQLRQFGNKRLMKVRSWPIRGFRNYLIFYRPIAGGIEVIRILHGARDIETIFQS